ncbi:conserved exported hypothetical protein [Burkholderiales bacterium 8X]|nr:conserved exported hypothetical protein [Burkholderiales bacterium 8X]
MRILICVLGGLLTSAACMAAWWFYWPVVQAEWQVQARLAGAKDVRISKLTYNRDTRTACGFVTAAASPHPPQTHFIALPDGTVRLDPSDRLRGTSLQQLEALKRRTEYLSLVYERCPRA